MSCLVSERLRRRGDSSVAAHRRRPGGSPSKHGAGAIVGAAPDDDMRWSPLVEAEERRCGDVAGTASAASVRRGGGGLARSSDGFTFAGAGVADAASRPAAARPTAAAAVVRRLRGRGRRGRRRRIAFGSGTTAVAWRGRPAAVPWSETSNPNHWFWV